MTTRKPKVSRETQERYPSLRDEEYEPPILVPDATDYYNPEDDIEAHRRYPSARGKVVKPQTKPGRCVFHEDRRATTLNYCTYCWDGFKKIGSAYFKRCGVPPNVKRRLLAERNPDSTLSQVINARDNNNEGD